MVCKSERLNFAYPRSLLVFRKTLRALEKDVFFFSLGCSLGVDVLLVASVSLSYPLSILLVAMNELVVADELVATDESLVNCDELLDIVVFLVISGDELHGLSVAVLLLGMTS